MFDHWLIMQLIAITRCQKPAKNPMQKLPKKPTKTPQKSFMNITSKKLTSEKFYSFGYLVAELEVYELKTFYDGKNLAHKFVGFTLYKAKKRFTEMIKEGIVKSF